MCRSWLYPPAIHCDAQYRGSIGTWCPGLSVKNIYTSVRTTVEVNKGERKVGLKPWVSPIQWALWHRLGVFGKPRENVGFVAQLWWTGVCRKPCDELEVGCANLSSNDWTEAVDFDNQLKVRAKARPFASSQPQNNKLRLKNAALCNYLCIMLPPWASLSLSPQTLEGTLHFHLKTHTSLFCI